MVDEAYSPVVISRKDARALGLKHYFTGKPCKRGHFAPRYVASPTCVQCKRYDVQSWRSENVARVRQLDRDGYARNIDKRREKDRKGYRANGARKRQYQKNRYWSDHEESLQYATEKRHEYKKTERGKEFIRRQKLAYRKKNPEKFRASIDNWFAKFPGRKQSYERNRRARKKGNGGSHTVFEIQEIFKMQKGKCAFCKIPLENVVQHVDHIIAIVNGGTNDRRNLQILCEPCNLMKGRRDQMRVMRTLGRLL